MTIHEALIHLITMYSKHYNIARLEAIRQMIADSLVLLETYAKLEEGGTNHG